MLILSRREGEVIRVNEEISIVVVKVKGSQVRLGVQAPSHVKVNREEIHLRISQTEFDALTRLPDGDEDEVNFNK